LLDVIEDYSTGFSINSSEKYAIFDAKYKKPEEDSELSLEVKANRIKIGDSNYLILSLKDMTERDQLIQLKGDSEFRNNMIASFSHELRTPLNANMNFIEQAIESNLIPEKVKAELLMPVLISAKQLHHIISDILDYSLILKRQLTPRFSQNILIETIRNCVSLIEMQAEKKGLKVRLDLESIERKRISTDHERVTQILLNIITNAVKFTTQGNIIIQAEYLEDDDVVVIHVKDTGIGMSSLEKSILSSILHEQKLGKKVASNSSGIGLGLYI